MIRTKKAERLIKAAGGLNRAKLILANVPDKTAFFFQPELGLYARTCMGAHGVMTLVFLGGKWVFWANPYGLMKLGELRCAVMLFEKADLLDDASNDSLVDFFPPQDLQKFTMGDYVVCLDPMHTDEALKIIEMHKHPVNGISYVAITRLGLKIKVPEASIRKAMFQEKLTRKRVNHIDEALTVTEIKNFKGYGHA